MRSLEPYRLFWVIGSIAFTSVTFASVLAGQTLFARPDTTPDYASYRYMEDCQNAILRLTEEDEARNEPIWYDTTDFNTRKRHELQLETSRRPDVAIQAGTVCLNKFDADTAQFWSVGYARSIIEVLLMAHRDQDARRFTQRFLDSMRQKPHIELRGALHALMKEYGAARPVRLDEVKHFYAELLVAVKDDSLYHTIDAAMALDVIARRVADTALQESAALQAIRTNDAMLVKERLTSPGADKRLPILIGMMEELTREDGLDSLAVSARAYALYQVNTVKARVYGEEWQRTPETIDLSKLKLPDVVGEHYYMASNERSSGAIPQGLASYTTKGTVPPGEVPVRNRVNLIVSVPRQCQAESRGRMIGWDRRRDIFLAPFCVAAYAQYRRMKQRFPDLELTMLTSTSGTVGMLGPLSLADEADTLAKLYLGFHRVPARLVVEETPFFHMPDPDGRRIDLPTPYAKLLEEQLEKKLGGAMVIDKEGLLVKQMGGFESDISNRFLDILIKRASK